MEFEFLNENNKDDWNNFVLINSSAWFRHTTFWIDYVSCCRFDSNAKNLSFIVKQNRKIQAIVPLLVEYSYPNKENNCFTMYGEYTPVIAISDECEVNSKTLLDEIFEKINEIAKEYNCKYGKFVIDPLIEYKYFENFSYFNYMNYNGTQNFSTTNIVDLRNDLDTIIRLMRKGHKAAIKQVEKRTDCRVDIFDNTNINKEVFSRYKEIHKIDAGRQTRTDASWGCMYNWVIQGNACLAMMWSDEHNNYVSGALIMMYKKSAYYASFATIDSFILNGHVGSKIQWKVINYLKSKGIRFYETGVNYYANSIWNESNPKLQEIAKYQRGYRSIEIPKITYRIDFN